MGYVEIILLIFSFWFCVFAGWGLGKANVSWEGIIFVLIYLFAYMTIVLCGIELSDYLIK